MEREQFENIIEQTASWPGGPPTHQPTDEEIQAVSALVKQESLQLEAIDNELSRLKALVSGLEQERASLARKMEAHRAYISPARRIPDDIVREIMIRCIPTDPPPSHAEPETGPTLLAHICSHWRTIAFSTPQIWSSLCVHFRLKGPRLSPWDPSYKIPPIRRFGHDSDSNIDERPLALWQKDVDIMRYWLSYSGTCPLTLSFGYIPSFSDVSCINSFFNFLIQTSHRWRAIDLIPTSDNSVTLPLPFRSAVACQSSPQLQSIRFPIIDITHTTFQELSWTNSEVLKSTNLRTLKCHRETERFSPGTHNASQCNSPLSSLPIADWGKIATLHLHCTNSHEVEDCIMLFAVNIRSLLEVFTLKLTYDERWPIPPHLTDQRFDVKFLPSLHVLDLDLPHDLLQKLFRMIAAPSLEDISIQMSSVYRITPDSIAADALQFLEQSKLIGPGGTSVHALKLDPIHYTRKTLYRILVAFSGVRKLVFRTEHDSSLSSLRYPNVRDEELWARRDAHVTLNRDSNIDDEFLLRLADQNTSDDGVNTEPPRILPFLPHLIDFTCFSRTSFSPDTLTQFLRARHQESPENNASRLQVLRLIEATEDYIGESSLLPKNVVKDLWLPFRRQGLTTAIVSIYRPEGRKEYVNS